MATSIPIPDSCPVISSGNESFAPSAVTVATGIHARYPPVDSGGPHPFAKMNGNGRFGKVPAFNEVLENPPELNREEKKETV